MISYFLWKSKVCTPLRNL